MRDHRQRQAGDDRGDEDAIAPGVEAKLVMGRCYGSTGTREKIQFGAGNETSRPRGPTSGALDETSQPLDVLLSVSRDGPGRSARRSRTSSARAIRDGSLRAGDARAVDARPGAPARRLAPRRRRRLRAARRRGLPRAAPGRPPARRRSGAAADAGRRAARRRSPRALPPRYDFRPSRPDVSAVPAPGVAALRCARRSPTMTDAELAYGDPRGGRGAAHRAGRLPRARARRRRRARRGSSSRAATPRASALVCRALRAARRAADRVRGAVVPRAAPDRRARRPRAGRRAGRRARASASTRCAGRGRRTWSSLTPGPPAPDRRRARRRPPHRAARLAARARRGRDRRRLRRRVPLRPRRRRRAPRPRPGPDRLRRLGQQDAHARRSASAGSCVPAGLLEEVAPREARSPTARRT